jgi:hypothetical protein
MKTLFKFSITSIFILIFSLSCKEKDITSPQVIALTEKIGNIGYKELDEASVKWALGNAFDPSVNPLLDETGSLSEASKQPIAGFTILPSNFGGTTTRSLTISKSNYVYMSPFGYFLWYYENDKCAPDFKPKAGQSVKDFLFSELSNFADFNKAIASVKVDGVEFLTDKSKFRVKSEVIETVIHKDFNNPACDYTGQKAKLISDGYAILMKLPKGNHKVEMRGEDSSDPANPFVAEVIWNLTVE